MEAGTARQPPQRGNEKVLGSMQGFCAPNQFQDAAVALPGSLRSPQHPHIHPWSIQRTQNHGGLHAITACYAIQFQPFSVWQKPANMIPAPTPQDEGLQTSRKFLLTTKPSIPCKQPHTSLSCHLILTMALQISRQTYPCINGSEGRSKRLCQQLPVPPPSRAMQRGMP